MTSGVWRRVCACMQTQAHVQLKERDAGAAAGANPYSVSAAVLCNATVHLILWPCRAGWASGMLNVRRLSEC